MDFQFQLKAWTSPLRSPCTLSIRHIANRGAINNARIVVLIRLRRRSFSCDDSANCAHSPPRTEPAAATQAVPASIERPKYKHIVTGSHVESLTRGEAAQKTQSPQAKRQQPGQAIPGIPETKTTQRFIAPAHRFPLRPSRYERDAQFLLRRLLKFFFHEIEHHGRDFKGERFSFFTVAVHDPFFTNGIRRVEHMQLHMRADFSSTLAKALAARPFGKAQIQHHASARPGNLGRRHPDLRFAAVNALHDP